MVLGQLLKEALSRISKSLRINYGLIDTYLSTKNTIKMKTPIASSISLERLKSYEILCPSCTESEIIGAYHWNLLMCQALYPFIHSAEVALRNAINIAIAQKFNTKDWFDIVIKDKVSIDILTNVKKELARKKQFNHADIVASLTFGFWTSLLKKKIYRDQYNKERLWPDLIPVVFPRYERKGGDDRKNIAQRFEEIKLIRNRLFHHEPIWKFKDSISPESCIAELRRKFNDIYKAIGWISKSKQEYLKKFGFVESFKVQCTGEMLEKFRHI